VYIKFPHIIKIRKHEDMTNYVGQREQFGDNYGTQNQAQNETHCAKVFKRFFDEEPVEIIVRESNTYAALRRFLCCKIL
jgi:hypothetical protein